MSDRVPRPAAALGIAVSLTLLLSGCGLFGGEDDGSVFATQPGECFLTPTKVEAQISSLDPVDCDEEHGQEAFAVLDFTPPGSEKATSQFPGDEALEQFAEGACAEAFGDYVGVSYLDSSLFFTYLLPSPRSWQEDDRSVICFATAAGRPMEGSVKGTKQ